MRSLASPFLVFEFHRCHSNHSIFIQRTKSSLVILAMYDDDILLTGSDSVGLVETKENLRRHFVKRTWVNLNTFLGLRLHIKKI